MLASNFVQVYASWPAKVWIGLRLTVCPEHTIWQASQASGTQGAQEQLECTSGKYTWTGLESALSMSLKVTRESDILSRSLCGQDCFFDRDKSVLRDFSLKRHPGSGLALQRHNTDL